MQEIKIVADNRSIKFVGDLITRELTDNNNCSSEYSGETGISHKICIYKTNKNNLIAEYYMFTQWQGGHNEHLIFVDKDYKNLFDQIPNSRCKKMAWASIQGFVDPEEL